MIKIRFLLFLPIICLFSLRLQSQVSDNNFNYQFESGNHRIQLVTFTPSSEDAISYIQIFIDDGSGTITGPHWTQDGEIVKDVGYVSGRKIDITARIRYDCTKPFWIRPKVDTNTTDFSHNSGATEVKFDFEEQFFPNDGGFNAVVYVGEAEKVLPMDLVSYYDNSFPIVWEIAPVKEDGSKGEYQPFQTTTHTLYVTKDEPLKSENVFETTIHLGCSDAHGYKSDTDLIEQIWEPFDKEKAFSVKRKDGMIFTYWATCIDDDDTCSDLSELLKSDSANGRCAALSDLLIAIWETQGISGVKLNSVEATKSFTNDFDSNMMAKFSDDVIIEEWKSGLARFAVKDWESFIENAEYNFFELSNIPAQCKPNWAEGDEGIEGQGGVPEPLSLHVNHAFVTYDGTIYDPSYGVVTTTPNPPSNNIPFDPTRALFNAHLAKSLDTVSGLIYTVTNINSGLVKYYYWIGQPIN